MSTSAITQSRATTSGKKLTVSVVSGSSKENLELCLASLKTAATELDCHVTVTDNCSAWDVASTVIAYFPDATIRQNERPLGFGENHNNALLAATDDYALIINDDLELRPDAINALLAAAEARPTGAAFGPLLFPQSWDAQWITAGGRLGEALPKPIITSCSMVIRASLGDGFIRGFLARRTQQTAPTDCQRSYISGACCLVRRSFVTAHGLYDPEFYMYFDDIDLGTRIRQNGHECWQVATANVRHLEGGSFSSRTWGWMMASARRYAWKHHGILVRLVVEFNLLVLRMVLMFKKPHDGMTRPP